MRRLVIGTRGSALARRQTEIVSEALASAIPGIEIEVRVVTTEGDRRQDVSLESLGGEGVFVKDIERRLQSGEINLAVHSLKDMPALQPADLMIGAVLPRGDVRDVLVGPALKDLPYNARVGTDSRRRSVQLLAMRPDLRLESIRGNVDTRVGKVASGEYDAAVLAMAGLERLGLEAPIGHVFTTEQMLPAVGQAVLAVQCRADDAELLDALALVDDPVTRAAITAERAYLRRLGAGCRLPVGAYAELSDDGLLHLRGLLADDAGTQHRDSITGPAQDADAMGAQLADRLAAVAGIATEQSVEGRP